VRDLGCEHLVKVITRMRGLVRGQEERKTLTLELRVAPERCVRRTSELSFHSFGNGEAPRW